MKASSPIGFRRRRGSPRPPQCRPGNGLAAGSSWKNVRVLAGPVGRLSDRGWLESLLRGARHRTQRRFRPAPTASASLFYRGVGQFVPPLTARTEDDGSVVVASTGPSPIGTVVAFENRGGRTAHRVLRDIGWESDRRSARARRRIGGSGAALVDILTANGYAPPGSGSDGRNVAGLVVRGRFAIVLHRAGAVRRRHVANGDHAGAIRRRPGVRRSGRAGDAGDRNGPWPKHS